MATRAQIMVALALKQKNEPWGTYPAIPADDESTEESDCEGESEFNVVECIDESECYDTGKDVLQKTAAILGTSLPEPGSHLVKYPKETAETSIDFNCCNVHHYANTEGEEEEEVMMEITNPSQSTAKT